MIAPLALVVVVLGSLQQAPQATGVVRGQVRSTSSGLPLRHATVQIVGSFAGQAVTSTDSTGSYVLRNVAPGWQRMRITHIDHAANDTEVLITGGKEVVLDFDLDLRPVRLPAVTANALIQPGIRDTIAAGPAALGPASVRALESTPGVAELGLAEIAREIPG